LTCKSTQEGRESFKSVSLNSFINLGNANKSDGVGGSYE